MDLGIQNVSKAFGATAALRDVSLSIETGELVALLGPSGSGKTTLLRLIAGLETPSAGAVFFGDEEASRRSVQERQVGFVFQHYALFRHMTVLENVAFGLTIRPRHSRPSKQEIERRALELISLVQLSGLESRYPQQLSGGQRQRVALARAMAIEPKVLLLDEPFGALDAQVRKDLRHWLLEIHARTRYTTLFVTHDQEEALELANRVVVMNEGQIVQIGTPDEVYDRPAVPFVHRFIGESSELPVRVEKGQIWFDDCPTGLASDRAGAGLLFFRPHQVEIAPEGSRCLEARVIGSRRLAGTRRLELLVGQSNRHVEIDVPLEHPVAQKQVVFFRPKVWTLFPTGDKEQARPETVGARLVFPRSAAGGSLRHYEPSVS
ncbi:sulfate/molybdate ABC transporter ATP-binding protein [uncultured Cohaesibacter sp.]|uniref:sulfate/molybdate ABC transporter ATP-binding protein n=1 Tax=uncultured Cohaesibacter sp. TaxID=1002546 RepID=UPI0029C77FAD|nr:sulfate/molybdate ABC transporter ATP-binding protein [uncultured Cohaesibacter sp.]